MLRTFDIIMIAAMLVAATVTYTIKYDAEKQIAVIAKLKRQIDSEKDTITLLRADWALMTQPGRLQSLVGVYERNSTSSRSKPNSLCWVSTKFRNVRLTISRRSSPAATNCLQAACLKRMPSRPAASRKAGRGTDHAAETFREKEYAGR